MLSSKKIFIFLFFFTLGSPGFSQDVNYQFSEITTKDGLSGNVVLDVLQDKMGFIWIATTNGLNKYDGYELTTYKNTSSNPNSISGNNCRFIFESSDGNLWIRTKNNGLNSYNRESNSFSRFEYYIDDEKFSGIPDVRTMEQDNDGNLWIGTDTGILVFSYIKGKITKINDFVKNFPEAAVNDIYFDNSNQVWIGTYSNGLYRYNSSNKDLIHFESNIENSNSISGNLVYQIEEDKDGDLWIATKSGLNKYNKKENLFSNFLINNETLANNYSYNIEIDFNDNIWISSPQQGVYQFDQLKHKFEKINSTNENISNDLQYGSALFQDRSGIMWIGTTNKGVKIYRPQFSGIKKHTTDLKNVSSGGATGFLRDSEGRLWVSDYNGIKSKDSTGKETFYKEFLKAGEYFPPHLISTILEGRNGDILIGTGVGLYKLDPTNNNFNYLDFIGNNQKLSIISCLYKDRRDVYWIGTFSNGLYNYDPKTKAYNFYQKNDSANSLSDNRINCIEEDINGFIWVGTSNGLNKFNRKDSSFTRYFLNQENSSNENNIQSILEDSKSQLLIGTEDGLMSFNNNNNSYERINFGKNLSENEILSMLEDDKKDIWISSVKELFRYNPTTNITTSFGAKDNLPINEFYGGVPYKDKNGILFFSESTGYVEINPSKMIKNSLPPKLSLTNFKVFNNSASISSDNNSFELKKGISTSDTIHLSYKDNMFSIEFSALDFVNSEKNQYAYQMQNLNENWIYTNSKNRIATFTNLDYKDYVFKLKGANSEGIWNDEGISLFIRISPPWWRTNWAHTLYLISFLSLLIGFIQWRALKLKRDKKVLLERVNVKTKDLANKNSQLDKQNLQLQNQATKLQELDKIKASFFANISHEFRTPLTVITGLANKHISNNENDANTQDSQTIKRNAHRLLQLINQLLDLSKLENSQVKLNILKTDILQFTKKVILLYHSLAKEKQIKVFFNGKSLSKSLPTQKIDLYFDKEKMQKIITNLISNAIKFTPNNGEIKMSVNTLKSNKKKPRVSIEISNTGSKIPKDKLHYIFDRFYQAGDINTSETEGTGIGLALVKELVELHNGMVNVKSNSSETTFVLNFPYDKKLLKNNNTIPELKTVEDIEENTIIATIDNDEIIDDEIPTKLELLVVEDNPDLRDYITSLLDQDYNVKLAGNGLEGLEMARNSVPDLIISDVMMPKMDGYKLCNKLKTDETTDHIPIILLTAKASQDSKLEGLETGADAYLTKPFDEKELKIRIKNLIDTRAKLQKKHQNESFLKPKGVKVISVQEKFLFKVKEIVEDNIDNDQFTIEELGDKLFMSRSQVHRKLKAITNQSATEFIRNYRLHRAADLLKQESGNVTEIAYQVGFSSQAYFSRSFQKLFGVSPTEYKNND